MLEFVSVAGAPSYATHIYSVEPIQIRFLHYLYFFKVLCVFLYHTILNPTGYILNAVARVQLSTGVGDIFD